MAGDQAPFFANWHDEFLPLSVAAEWIAIRGGNATPDLADPRVWDAPIKQLLRAAQRGDLPVKGYPNGDKSKGFAPIPPEVFLFKWISPFPSDDELFDHVLDKFEPYIDFTLSGDGPTGSDKIHIDNKVLWSCLIVAKSDVTRIWRYPRPETRGPSDDDILTVIRKAMDENGDYIPLDKGAEIVRQEFPTVTRSRARALVKSLTKSDKRGPRGPRTKSAGKSAAK